MQLIYEGVDITGSVDVAKCIHRDVSGGRCDSMEIVLENAEAWYRWKPQKDDTLEATLNGYTTGKLYLSTVLPEDGKYRIIATSLPSAARNKNSAGYEGMNLGSIAALCASECGMDYALYGVDRDNTYDFLLRTEESAPAFLSRILQWEGAVLKALDGRLTAISVEYAQSMSAAKTITLSANQHNVRHVLREEAKLSAFTIRTPFASGTAIDTAATYGPHVTRTAYPVLYAAEAGRWARGVLLSTNRAAEELNLATEFDPAMTAMTRIDITSATDADGQWLVDEAEHDFIQGSSRVKLLRCIQTIK